MLEVAGLTKRFGGLVAVAGLDIAVPPATINALIGPNGAGKSTVINLLCGFTRPSEGRVRFDGKDITGRAPHRIAAAGMVRTFQSGRLFRRLTVLENVLVGGNTALRAGMVETVLRLPSFRREEAALEERARHFLAQSGLTGDADRLVGELPYGKQRKVEIARALVGGPRMLLLDEPAAGLNSAEVEALGAFLKLLRDDGLAMLLVEHHMGMVMKLADRVTVLNFGERIFEGVPAEVAASETVIEAYLGRRKRHAVL